MLSILVAASIFLSGLGFEISAETVFNNSGPQFVAQAAPLDEVLFVVDEMNYNEEIEFESEDDDSTEDYVSNLDSIEEDLLAHNGYRRCGPSERKCVPQARKCHPVARKCKPKCQPKCHKPRRRLFAKSRCCAPQVRKCQPVARKCEAQVRKCQPKCTPHVSKCFRPEERKCHPAQIVHEPKREVLRLKKISHRENPRNLLNHVAEAPVGCGPTLSRTTHPVTHHEVSDSRYVAPASAQPLPDRKVPSFRAPSLSYSEVYN